MDFSLIYFLDDPRRDSLSPYFKSEIEPKSNSTPPPYGAHGGLLAQALLDKRSSSSNSMNSHTNFHNMENPNSTMSNLGGPNDIAQLKMKLGQINRDPTLSTEQKNAKISEIFSLNPQLRKIVNEKIQRDKKY